jgi:L-threonylcarbamoyladenylate synthase
MNGTNPQRNGRIRVADDQAIAIAADILRSGGIVAVPTETVYGLAADASNVDGVAAIYRTKGRPDFNPLIVHVPDSAAARKLAVFDARSDTLAATFWPGPLTIVLPLAANAVVTSAVTAGLETIAIRCPAHPVMQKLLRYSGLFLAAPSANRSGHISPTSADHVIRSLGDAAPMILDAGPCADGLESTIVAVRGTGWQILRHGPITAEALIAIMGSEPGPVTGNQIEAPGQMASHYAPIKPLRLNAAKASADEWFIGFGDMGGNENLSPAGDLAQAAACLFGALHTADDSKSAAIAVAPIPRHGIGAAINDRLWRAAQR